MYHSLVEDYFTGFKKLHCQGWKSVYLTPSRPQFLGTSTTNLNDLLTQGTRWGSGLAQVLISKFSPLIYGLPRMSLLASMGYAELASFPIYSFPLWCFATIPQLCLLNGIPLYPEVSPFLSHSVVSSSSLCVFVLDIPLILHLFLTHRFQTQNFTYSYSSFYHHYLNIYTRFLKREDQSGYGEMNKGYG